MLTNPDFLWSWFLPFHSFLFSVFMLYKMPAGFNGTTVYLNKAKRSLVKLQNPFRNYFIVFKMFSSSLLDYWQWGQVVICMNTLGCLKLNMWVLNPLMWLPSLCQMNHVQQKYNWHALLLWLCHQKNIGEFSFKLKNCTCIVLGRRPFDIPPDRGICSCSKLD